MSSKDWRVRVEDMLEAIERIGRYIEAMSAAEFLADERTQDAVIRNLEILGEASKRIPSAITQRHPKIPWSRIGDMRNSLRVVEQEPDDGGVETSGRRARNRS